MESDTRVVALKGTVEKWKRRFEAQNNIRPVLRRALEGRHNKAKGVSPGTLDRPREPEPCKGDISIATNTVRAPAKKKDANPGNEKFYSAHALTPEQAIRVALGIPEPAKKAKPSDR